MIYYHSLKARRKRQFDNCHMTPSLGSFHCYNRKVNKEDTMVFDSVDLLVQVYEDYVTKQGLPYVSADEQDKSELTDSQVRWIESFETLWDLAS